MQLHAGAPVRRCHACTCLSTHRGQIARCAGCSQGQLNAAACHGSIPNNILLACRIPIAELQQAVQQVMKTSCSNAQLEGATFIQRLLSREKDPPIDVVARVPGLIQRFVQLLDDDSAPKLQFEACWVLTNVCFFLAYYSAACACITH